MIDDDDPRNRIENVCDVLPFWDRVWYIYLPTNLPYYLQLLHGVLMKRTARFIFVATLVSYLVFLWAFADKLPGRLLLLAGVFAGAVAIAALVAMFIPWGGNGGGGDDTQ
jgi:hypothetical protein